MPKTNPAPSAATTRLLAAIDIGTVSTRLIVALADAGAGAGTPFVILERQALITDLGEGVDASGALAAAAVARTVAAVSGYVGRIREHAAAQGLAAHVSTTTTSAARDARNADDLLGPLRDLGLEPQVIAGEVEATLALLGVTADFCERNVLVADIGGGSTELTSGTRAVGGTLVTAGGVSYNVGCRRVTERFFADGQPATTASEQAARAFIAQTLAPRFAAGMPPVPAELVCVGGTATSLVAILTELAAYDSRAVHLYRMEAPAVHELAGRLLSLSAAERAQLPGLQPKRAGVIAAGALILDVLLGLGGWDAYTASESDSLIGLLTCMQAALAQAEPPLAWAPRLATLLPDGRR